MSETPPDYIRTHRLPAKYGFGAAALALAVLASIINGDTAALTGLKTLAFVPIAIAWICLPQIFNPERSKRPFTASFIERTLLEGLVLMSAIGIVAWTPDRQPLGIAVAAVVGVAVYFGMISLVYRIMHRRR